MIKNIFHSLVFATGSLLVVSSTGNAQEIQKGMSFGEILASSQWGVPKEKISYETSRVEKWLYDKSRSVSFQEGRVQSWQTAKNAFVSSAAESANTKDTKKSLPDQVMKDGGTSDLRTRAEVRKSEQKDKKEKSVSVASFLSDVEKEGGETAEAPKKPQRGKKRGR